MRIIMLSRLALWIVWSAMFAQSYKIDKSCENAGIAQQVDQSMISAFAMARAARDALDAGVHMDDFDADVKPARDPVLENLIKNVFAHGDIINNKTPEIKQPSQYRYRMTLKNLKLGRVHLILSGILEHMEARTDDPGANDVTIYCDGSRLKPTNGGKTVIDEDRGGIVMGTGKKGKEQDGVDKCAKSDLGFSFAVTWGQPAGNIALGENPKEYSAAIQLCKATVANVKRGWFNNYVVFHKANPLGIVNRMLTSINIFKFRQVDALKLLDVTLLHEMTHARGAKALDDVRLNGLFMAYRWDGIKDLAKREPYVDRGGKTAPDNNAESIAYFGLGCLIMSDTTGPQEITDKGQVKKLNTPVTF